MSVDRLLDTVSATNITHKRNNKTCELIIDSNCTINSLQEINSLVSIPSISVNYDSAATNIVQLFTSDNISNYKIDLPDGEYLIRKLTPLECERLQTLPDGYTEGVSNTQRYKAIGNGWTVDVIAHIFKHLNT